MIVIFAYFGEISGGKPVLTYPSDSFLAERADMRNIIGIAADALRKKSEVHTLGVFTEQGREDALRFIRNNATKIDLCIWWHHGVSADFILTCKRTLHGAKHVIYNFDPTRNVFAVAEDKLSLFDKAFVTDSDEPVYKCPTFTLYAPCQLVNTEGMTKNGVVFFACTNLYRSERERFTKATGIRILDRSEIISELSKAYGAEFTLCAPTSLGSMFPASWKGEMPYHEMPFAHVSHEVNICLTVDPSVKGYLNQRICDAAMVGSNILAEEVNGLRDIFGDCIAYIDPDRPIVEQVEQARHRSYDRDRLVGIARKLFSPDVWASTIMDNV